MFEENIDPGFRILFLRPLQLDYLINFKKVLHDDYIKIISYPVKYHLRYIIPFEIHKLRIWKDSSKNVILEKC